MMPQCRLTGGVSASTFAPKNPRETSSTSLIGKSVPYARAQGPGRVSQSESENSKGDKGGNVELDQEVA